MPYIPNKPLELWRALSCIAVGIIVLSIALPASGVLTWYQVVNYLLLSICCVSCFIMPFCRHKSSGYKAMDCLMLLYGVYIALHYFVFVRSYVEMSVIEGEYIVLLYFCIRNMGVSAQVLETCCIYALFGVFIVEIMYILFHGQYVYGNSMSLSLTGTFFNSSSLAMLVAVVLVLTLQILLHHFVGRRMVQRRYLALLVCIVALAVAILVITFSRTAVIALCVGCVAIFRDRISRKMMIVCVTSVLLLVCVSYFIRTASSNSRLLYYWCALCSFLDNPMLGVGIGKFMSSLTHYQSLYFVNNPSSALINDVDVTFYAYNEFLKILVEQGLLGFCMFLFICLRAIRGLYIQRSFLLSVFMVFLVFSLFSYPLSLIQFRTLFALTLAIAADGENDVKRISRLTSCFFIAMMAVSVICTIRVGMKYKATRQYVSSTKGQIVAPSFYSQLYPNLKDNPAFMFDYALSLHEAGDYEGSTDIAKLGSAMSSDPMFYSLIASNYKGRGNVEVAATFYNHAFRILPNRMYPLYSLMLLYDESGEHETAVFYADSIFKFHPKVESYMTEQMKAEAQSVLLKGG